MPRVKGRAARHEGLVAGQLLSKIMMRLQPRTVVTFLAASSDATGFFINSVAAVTGNPEDVAPLNVLVRKEGAPIPKVLVRFRALNGTAGGTAVSDASGKATIWMQGMTGGLLRIEPRRQTRAIAW